MITVVHSAGCSGAFEHGLGGPAREPDEVEGRHDDVHTQREQPNHVFNSRSGMMAISTQTPREMGRVGCSGRRRPCARYVVCFFGVDRAGPSLVPTSPFNYELPRGIEDCDECGHELKSALVQHLHRSFDSLVHGDSFLARTVK